MKMVGGRTKKVLTGQFLTEKNGLGEVIAIRRFPMGTIKTVLDLGAHVGMFSVLAKLLHPGARVISIEPESTNFDLLTQNTRNLGIEARQLSVGCHGMTVLIEGSNNVSHTFQYQNAPMGSVLRFVPSSTFPELVAGFNIDTYHGLFVKIDIEGAERTFLGDSKTEEILRRCVGIDFEGHTTVEIPNAYDYIDWLRECFSDTHDITEMGTWGNVKRRRGAAAILIKKNIQQIQHPLSQG